MELGLNQGDKNWLFVCVYSPEPPYTVTRFNGEKQEKVFFLMSFRNTENFQKVLKTQLGSRYSGLLIKRIRLLQFLTLFLMSGPVFLLRMK